MNQLLPRIKDVFNRLNGGNLDLLQSIYAPDVEFEDPVRRLHGLSELTDYYRRLYEGVTSCRFDFDQTIEQGNQAVLTWVMHVEHARFRRGEIITLAGASHLRFDARIDYHRDYFDMGEFLYERIPVLSAVIRHIKQRL
ncbi:nuclear transport factor 2 family protein [Methylotetracoccus oryzae]|uniref:nuclear transport factor 2 family protein n=1 Tax=Methylotetracoccus oryzae TaxID=1919059 RepID=UPI0011198ECE|nr:nuclear transport factor 2 family protein [Methylotetracoccus oryzae]